LLVLSSEEDFTMKTDTQLQEKVLEELTGAPRVTTTALGVAVNNGAVTLSGLVPNYTEKAAAELATLRIPGVKSVAGL